MGVMERHSHVPVPHLSLPVGQGHTDLLPEGGMGVAENMPTQPRNFLPAGFRTRRSRLFSFRGVPLLLEETRSSGPMNLDSARKESRASTALRPNGRFRFRDFAFTLPNFPR